MRFCRMFSSRIPKHVNFSACVLRSACQNCWSKQWNGRMRKPSVLWKWNWQLLQRLSQQQCNCGGACAWQEAAEEFAARNRETIGMDLLAASLANIICNGPSKTARVLLIAGVTNAGKSLMLDPLVEVFGRQHVDFCPALGATMPLSSLATCDRMRFIYWDEYSPTEFASRPARAPTIPAVTFKKLFAGQYLRLQVSQAHHDGNPDFRWTRGVSHHPVRCSDCNYQSIETDSTLRKHLVRICRAKVHGLCQSCGVAARAHPDRWCGLVTYFMPMTMHGNVPSKNDQPDHHGYNATSLSEYVWIFNLQKHHNLRAISAHSGELKLCK